MKNNLVKLLSVLAAVSAAGTLSAEVVYQNTTTKLGSTFSSPNEFGDQIILGGSGRKVTDFSMEYSTTGTFSGNESGRLRFYANDGAGSGGRVAPSSVLYDSGTFALGMAPTGLNLNFNGLEVNVPDSFTFTIAFGGIENGEVAGLNVYSPPTIGNGFTDIWENNGGTWELRKANDNTPLDFGAQVTAVPEPGTLALGAMGLALAVAAYARRKKA